VNERGAGLEVPLGGEDEGNNVSFFKRKIKGKGRKNVGRARAVTGGGKGLVAGKPGVEMRSTLGGKIGGRGGNCVKRQRNIDTGVAWGSDDTTG